MLSEKRKLYLKRWYRENLKKERKRIKINARNRRKKLPLHFKKLDKKHREKRKFEQRVMNKVSWAIESGKIKKPKYCFCCGNKKSLQGHHKDYDKPLELIWLCSACHNFLHSYLRTIDDIKARMR